jgi:hypothetical protein
MTLGTIGAILIGVSIAMYLTGKFRTLSAVMVFAGILLTGFNGWIVTHVAGLLTWVNSWAGAWLASVTGWSLATVGAVIVCMIIYKVLHDWSPRNSAKKSTYVLSALLAILIVAGATPFAALNQLPSSVQTGVNTVQGG